MKTILSLSQMLFIITALDVSVSDKCRCTDLLSKYDCLQDATCFWDEQNYLCKYSEKSAIRLGYCESIKYSSVCAETKGCAYIGSLCKYFAGCSAYEGSSISTCQGISRICIYNGSGFCVENTSCQIFDEQKICDTGKSKSGDCIWDKNVCRKRECMDAGSSFNTDSLCNNFLSGCITNGKGCQTAPLGPCSSYSYVCNGLKGSDGYCMNGCKPDECQNYPLDQCGKYGCVSNGATCLNSSLGLCSSFSSDSNQCNSMKGSDGRCKQIKSNYCGIATCEDASSDCTTDVQCDQFRAGCVTTGQGCVQTRQPCNKYNSQYCNRLIGSDGRCSEDISKQGQLQQCFLKKCEQADLLLNADEQCNAFQYGCKTNGRGCVNVLQPCSSYKSNSNSCETYIGSDGKCKNGLNGQCAVRECKQAPTTVTSHQDCQNYQKGCIYSGQGCIIANSCDIIKTNSLCTGLSNCQYTSQCIKNVSCKDFNTEYLCTSVKLQNGDSCQWVDGKCKDISCDQASKDFHTDSLCNIFKKGCVTNGNGCVSQDSPCSSFSGTKITCEMNQKCSNVSDNTVGPCQERRCSDNKSSKFDSECNTYLKGCVTINPGCISEEASCSQYVGSSIDTCSKFIGSFHSKPCWWESGTKCTEKKCSQVQFTSNDACNSFLPQCMTNGSSCIENPAGCVSRCLILYNNCPNLIGTEEECLLNKCSRRELCKTPIQQIMNCIDIQSPTSQQSCENVLPGKCYFLQNKCIAIQLSCNSYKSSSLSDCINLYDSSGNQCYWISDQNCIQKQCSHETTSTSIAVCETFLKNCTKKLDSNGCEIINCNNVLNPEKEANCVSYHSSCHLKYDIATSKFICAQINNCNETAMSPGSKCTEAITNSGDYCIQDGSTNKCKSPDCSVLDNIHCNTAKVIYKADITYSLNSAQFCFYNIASSKCEVRSCAAASIHLGQSNLKSRTNCSNYFDQCALSYSGPQNGPVCVNAITSKGGGCTILIGSSKDCNELLQGRYFINGKYEWRSCYQNPLTEGIKNCQDRACNQVVGGYTDSICQTYLSTCKTDGIQCVDQSMPCENMTGNVESCAKLSSKIQGIKCYQEPLKSGFCSIRLCSDNTTATSDAECQSYLSGCITTGFGCISNQISCTSQYGTYITCSLLTSISGQCGSFSKTIAPCEQRKCQHNTSSTTDLECDSFLNGCVTNGAGCISKNAECSSYYGTQKNCQTFIGNGVKCTNSDDAIETTACIKVDCSDAESVNSEIDCQIFGQHCHYYGDGCKTVQKCSDLKGSHKDCMNYFTSDGRCKGTIKFQQCEIAQCYDAPNTYTTDSQCQIWKTGCLTNGMGCQSQNQINCNDIVSLNACQEHLNDNKNECTWFQTCQAMPITCNDIKDASLCQNSQSTMGVCTWKQSCTQANCSDVHKNSEAECVSFSPLCTYSGSGCVTKGACTTYEEEEICVNAKTTDPEGCTWNEQSQVCKIRNCDDAPKYLKSDLECNLFKLDCVTNGAGCSQLPLECKDFKSQDTCYKDTQEKPCLWYKNTCYQYYQCESLPFQEISECQEANQYCISDGKKCIPINICENYQESSMCQIGIYSNEIKQCYFDKEKGCRQMKCSDFLITNHQECQIASQTWSKQCTTNGTNCISMENFCSSYYFEQACVKTTEKYCFWSSELQRCFDFQCSFVKEETACSKYYQCIQDGVECISQGLCSNYKTKQACIRGGTDGKCVFTREGRCKLFTECKDADDDMDACNSRSNSCLWTPSIETEQSQCKVQTCNTAAKGTAMCVNVPNFNQTKYTICVQMNGKCVTGDPNKFKSDTCYRMSQYTYAWHGYSNNCTFCQDKSDVIKKPTNNTTKTESNNTNTNTSTNTTQYAPLFFNLLLVIYLL